MADDMFEYRNLPFRAADNVLEVTIRIESDWEDPRYAHPSDEELARVPDRFTCFVCLGSKKQDQFGSFILDQYVCRTCFMWADERVVGGLIRFHYIRRLSGSGGSLTQYWRKEPVPPQSYDWDRQYKHHHKGDFDG